MLMMVKYDYTKRINSLVRSVQVALLVLALTAQTPLLAQLDGGTFRLGGQVGLGTEIESFGLGVRGDYALTPKFLLATDFMYFFGDEDFGIEHNWFDVNFNANYLIELRNKNLYPYLLGGLNLARTAVKCEGVLSALCDEFSETDTGFNLGGGLDIMVGSLALFGELRVTLGNADQVVLAGGIKLPLN